MTYDMTVVSQNANWYVQGIRASSQPQGAVMITTRRRRPTSQMPVSLKG